MYFQNPPYTSGLAGTILTSCLQVYSESKDALDPLKEEIKNELPPQRDIAIVDKYFVVSENARKYVLICGCIISVR